MSVPYKGVKLSSPLNDLRYFHVCSPGLPPCIGHDLFEGIIPHDLMLCINYFVKQRILTFEFLNLKIRSIKFDHNKKETFGVIKKGDKLIGNASEILYILNVFPFILYEKIDLLKDCEIWNMVLILRKLVNIVLAFRISADQIAVLRDLLYQYIQIRKDSFSDVKLRPKHHFILHYPYLIRKFGPLRHLWTLRFESKHKYFKDIIRRSPNFKNILLSLSTKHQLLEALSSNDQNLYCDKAVSDNFKQFDITNYPSYWLDLLNKDLLSDFRFITEDLYFRGIIYRKHMFVCYNKDLHGIYSLCQIKYILVSENMLNLYFLGSSIKIYYNVITGLYHQLDRINTEQKRNVEVFVSFTDLICSETLINTSINSEQLFYFKSAPLENI